MNARTVVLRRMLERPPEGELRTQRVGRVPRSGGVRSGGMGRGSQLVVGRAAELEMVRHLVDHPEQGSILVLEGEAGIGKTTLVDVACARAVDHGIPVARAAAEDLLADRPAGLLVRALDGADPTSAGPLVWPADPGAAADDPGAALGAGGVPMSVLDQLLDRIEALAAGGRLLVALDDLQWADPGSLLALAPLARRAVPLGVSFLLSWRPEPRPEALDRLFEALDRQGARHFALPALTPAEVDALVQLRAGPALTDRLRRLATGTGGNPFYVIELVDAERDQPGVGGSLPESLQKLLVRRVRAGGDDLAELLQVAAVLGRTVHLDELVTVQHRPVAELAALLRRAVGSGVLVDDDGVLAFRHDLVREALLDDSPAAIRRALHRQVAAALDAGGATPERIARHLLRGIEPPDAVSVRRIRELCNTLPKPVAAELLGSARDLVGPGDPERSAVEAAYVDAVVWSRNPREGERLAREAMTWVTDPEWLFDLRASRSYALFQLGDPRGAFESWEASRAGDTAMAPSEHSDLGVAKLFAGDIDGADASATIAIEGGASPAGVRVARGIRAWVAATRGDLPLALHETALSLASHEAPQADEQRLPYDIPDVYRAVVLDGAGRGPEAIELLARDVPVLGARGSVAVGVLRHACAAVALFRVGRWDEALAEVDAGLGLSRDAAVRLGDGWLIGVRAMIAVHRGNPAAAAAALADQDPDGLGPTLGMDWLAWARALTDAATGREADAAGILSMVVDVASAMGVRSTVGYIGPDLVRLTLAAGGDDPDRLDRARIDRLVDAAGELADLARSGPAIASHLLISGLASESPDPGRLRAAADRYAECHRPLESARALHDAAVASARAGDDEGARDAARLALAGYATLDADGAAARLRSDLRAAGVRLRAASAPRPHEGWDSLTASEVTVVALVGEGLSNAAIAERLFVSRRTVESHLGRVYAKLSIGSRLELARQAGARAEPVDR